MYQTRILSSQPINSLVLNFLSLPRHPRHIVANLEHEIRIIPANSSTQELFHSLIRSGNRSEAPSETRNTTSNATTKEANHSYGHTGNGNSPLWMSQAKKLRRWIKLAHGNRETVYFNFLKLLSWVRCSSATDCLFRNSNLTTYPELDRARPATNFTHL